MKKNKSLWIHGFGVFLVVCIMMVWPGLAPVSSQESGPVQEKAEPPAEEIKPEGALPVAEVETGPIVTYQIEAQLLPESRKITASQILSWLNTSSAPVEHVRFHLYYNAFRSLQTTFLQEAQYYKKPMGEQKHLKFGEIVIKDIQRPGGADLTGAIKYIAPDDGNENDRTVMELKLDSPVEPGQTLRLKINFSLSIPQIFARTGMEGDYFFIGQWFPKIGVLQADGQWHCHQFHYNSEFFADYGEYKVAITCPNAYVLGATGNLIKTEKNVDETSTYFYEEKNIHDFAWTAYPHFLRSQHQIKLPGTKEYKTIELLIAKEHEASRERHLQAVSATLDFYARYILPYPYQKITVVDPPLKGMQSGGMEYPTLITSFSSGLIPSMFHVAENTTIHEFSHQYWYGLVGFDEFTEAWLDEGIATFFSGEIAEEYFKGRGSALDSFFLAASDLELSRLVYADLLPVDAPLLESWKFLNRRQYGGNVYHKVAVLLRSLRNLVGKERMYGFFKYYAGKFQFKHPRSEDFIETFNNYMNDDYSWAFDLYIRGEGGLNHGVHHINATQISSHPVMYRNSAEFIRTEGYFPVDLLLTLENGKEIKSTWHERDKWKKILFDDPSPLKQAVIDPQYKVPLDKNYLDNSLVIAPKKSGIKRLAIKLGFFFQGLLSLFSL